MWLSRAQLFLTTEFTVDYAEIFINYHICVAYYVYAQVLSFHATRTMQVFQCLVGGFHFYSSTSAAITLQLLARILLDMLNKSCFCLLLYCSYSNFLKTVKVALFDATDFNKETVKSHRQFFIILTYKYAIQHTYETSEKKQFLEIFDD